MVAVVIVGAIIVAWFAIEGFRQGVVRRLVEVVGLVAMFLLASGLAARAQPWIDSHTILHGEAAFYGAWALVLIGGILLIRIISNAVGRAVSKSVVGWLDRSGGLILGAAFGMLSLSILLVALLALPLPDGFEAELGAHPFLGRALHVAPDLYDWAREVWDGDAFFDAVRQGSATARDAVRPGDRVP